MGKIVAGKTGKHWKPENLQLAFDPCLIHLLLKGRCLVVESIVIILSQLHDPIIFIDVGLILPEIVLGNSPVVVGIGMVRL